MDVAAKCSGGLVNVGSLFSGCGLLDLGLCLAGHDHSWFVEADPFRRDLLAKRWPGVSVHDDVRTVGARNLQRVDGIVGGFPCKGASTAGKRNGFDHAETVLWREMARAVSELEPRYVVVENVANILAIHDGVVWGEVLSDLAALGFDVEWDCFPAAAFGAPHLRDRVIAVATHTAGAGGPAGRGRECAGSGQPGAGRRDHAQPSAEAAPDAARDAEGRAGTPAGTERKRTRIRAGATVEWGEYATAIARWEGIVGPAPEPLIRRVDDRSAARVERSRLSALGDGVQVQLGRMVGEYLLDLDAAAHRAASAGALG